MSVDRLRRLAAIEARRPHQQRRVAIVDEDAVAPADATFVIRLVAADFPNEADQPSTVEHPQAAATDMFSGAPFAPSHTVPHREG